MLTGLHYQNAYVTRDIEKAIAGFRARGDVADATSFLAETEVTTPSGRGKLANRLSFIWINNLQYELIQPLSGLVNVYRDWLPANDDLRFHHSCTRVDNWEKFRSGLASEGLPVVLEGGHDLLRFVYVDARSTLGHYLEYTWMTPDMWSKIGGK